MVPEGPAQSEYLSVNISVQDGLGSYQETGRLFPLLAAMGHFLYLSVTWVNHLARGLGIEITDLD